MFKIVIPYVKIYTLLLNFIFIFIIYISILYLLLFKYLLFIIMLTVPDAPAEVNVTDVTTTSAVLTWTNQKGLFVNYFLVGFEQLLS